MFAQTFGAATYGLHGVLVHVEVDIANGIPGLEIVGLPDTAVKESRERVRAAIKNSGFEFPARRITVNLAPADIRKESSGLDLAIAAGILAASGQIDKNDCMNHVFIGELSLEGVLRKVSGVLSMSIQAVRQGIRRIMTAPDNAQEALLAGEVTVFAPRTLTEVLAHLSRQAVLPAESMPAQGASTWEMKEDFAEVQGQFVAKRAMEIAAAGGHNLLMMGPPGSGKTMLARRIAGILPGMLRHEALEVTQIYSVAGITSNMKDLIWQRPFRNPHHTASPAGIIGGGTIPKPGEVTLSHNGILFLDELPEFPRQVLEVLRQPLEDGRVTVSRVTASLEFPAKFMLIAAMNPCPCGFLGDSGRECSCTPLEIRRYRKKISGPLLDRIDIHVRVPRLEYGELTGKATMEKSAVIRARVETARNIQKERLGKKGIACNAQMGHKSLQEFCPMTGEAQKLLQQAFEKMKLSARGYSKVVKVARTISDLAGAEVIGTDHVGEALQYRSIMQESEN